MMEPRSLAEETQVTSPLSGQQGPNLTEKGSVRTVMDGVKEEGFGKQDDSRIQGESEMSHCSKLQNKKAREPEENEDQGQRTYIMLHV